MLKNIVIISGGYPSEQDSSYAFVDQLVSEWARMGVDCTVIAPQSITNYLLRKSIKKSFFSIKKISNGKDIKIYRPEILTFSNLPVLKNIGVSNFHRAVYNTLKRINARPSAIYGHFWRHALAGYKFAKEQNIPLFVATGESVIDDKSLKNTSYFNAFRDYISGVVAVSSKSKEESLAKNLILPDIPVIIAPNAIDNSLFRIKNKTECRLKIGASEDDFIVCFTGAFTHRKGALRVQKALEKINNPKIKAIFIGNGEEAPSYQYTIFQGKLLHNQIPDYLNAADIFVLPTLNEGCCNAIVEAMACGLPIISSDRSFNQDILDDKNAILIDPKSIDEIAQAILALYNDPIKRANMAEISLYKSHRLTIDKRAGLILKFMS